jgi:hypothetical protein
VWSKLQGRSGGGK